LLGIADVGVPGNGYARGSRCPLDDKSQSVRKKATTP
jgi:hypothetical protein